MAAFDLAIVTRRVGADELVDDTEFSDCTLKQGRKITLRIRETVGKLEAIVGLDTLDLDAFSSKGLDNLSKEVSGGEGALFRISPQDAVTGIFINGGILV